MQSLMMMNTRLDNDGLKREENALNNGICRKRAKTNAILNAWNAFER